MKEHDQFINTYKKIEGLIKTLYPAASEYASPIKYYEDVLAKDELETDKLRLCRNIRNYIQHHDDYNIFISIDPGMQKFLDSIYENLLIINKTCKSEMKTLKASTRIVTPQIKLIEAVAKMKTIAGKKKNNTLVVMKDNQPIGIFNGDCINNAILDGAKIRQSNIINYMIPITAKSKFIKYVDEHMSYQEGKILLDAGYIVFIVNKEQKIIGIL